MSKGRSDEQVAVDQLDALQTAGELNAKQVNDLENVAMTNSNRDGSWSKNGQVAFDSALRAAINKYGGSQ
jgi:hypothetical protein